MLECGYCGKANEVGVARCCICGMELVSEIPAELPQEKPPPLPPPEFIQPDVAEAAFSFENGFNRVDWDAIGRWIEANVSPLDADAAWSEAALIWVKRLRDDLGGEYFVMQSGQTILLCDQTLDTARWLLDYANRTDQKINALLGEVAWGGAFARDVILLFSDHDDYYEYLAHYSRDGEQAQSGGVFINSGYTHIAIPWRDEHDAANAVVHELTHACLAHLPIPLWLNEGVAVTLQRAIAPPNSIDQTPSSAVYSAAINWRPPIMWSELAERHHAFWNEETIQTFWAGTSFNVPGDSNELSYSLAEVLVNLLSERVSPGAFQALLQTAHYSDAGQTAMLDILQTDLGELAGTFLGEGNWRPVRKALVQCWSAAGWKMEDAKKE